MVGGTAAGTERTLFQACSARRCRGSCSRPPPALTRVAIRAQAGEKREAF